MPAVKLQKFLGIAPKISSELLPEKDGHGAQVSHNTQLYSGDIIPYHDSALVDSAEQTGELLTLHALRLPADGTTPVWLSWSTDVDVITLSDSNDDEQRFYYTGDGVPKVSNYELATGDAGAEPYPVSGGSYDLGLPLPTVQLTADDIAFVSPQPTTHERNSGNTAIITTTAAHNLRSGQVVSIRDLTGTPGTEFNQHQDYCYLPHYVRVF